MAYITNTIKNVIGTSIYIDDALQDGFLYEGVNNITQTNNDLPFILDLKYRSSENPYYNAIYSEDDRNDLKIWFNGVELENAGNYCEKITRIARILPSDGSKRFSLDNFIATNLEVILHNVNLETIQDQVEISIGTLVSENTYEYVPLGIFNIQDTPENDKGKITLKLRDNRVKFDFNYNAQPLIEQLGGSATKKQILDDICTTAGVTNTITSFNGDSDLIGIYDNTISGATYVSYLMEQAGLIAVIDRQGRLAKVDLSNLYTWRIPARLLEKDYEIGSSYKIDRVVYESGIIKYETSQDETLDTLYLNSANPYISSNEQVQYIYNKLKDFVIDSVETKRILGNPAIDPYDLIEVYNDSSQEQETIFKTLANTTYTFNGKHRDVFDTQIGIEQRKENASLNNNATFQKYARTRIDNVEGKITTEVGNVSGNLDRLNKKLYGDETTAGDIVLLQTSVEQKVDSTIFNTTYLDVEDIKNNGVTKVKTTSVTINNAGINVSTDTSKISTQTANNAFQITDNGGTILTYIGYDEEEGISKAKMDNLTVTNYFIAGNHRVEDYEENGEHRTGWFYMED